MQAVGAVHRTALMNFDCGLVVICRGLLQSGLGRFGLVQKQPQPGDYATVIVFVVGGMSLADLREVRLAVDGNNGNRRIMLGGTSLLSPHQVVDSLFQ